MPLPLPKIVLLLYEKGLTVPSYGLNWENSKQNLYIGSQKCIIKARRQKAQPCFASAVLKLHPQLLAEPYRYLRS